MSEKDARTPTKEAKTLTKELEQLEATFEKNKNKRVIAKPQRKLPPPNDKNRRRARSTSAYEEAGVSSSTRTRSTTAYEEEKTSTISSPNNISNTKSYDQDSNLLNDDSMTEYTLLNSPTKSDISSINNDEFQLGSNNAISSLNNNDSSIEEARSITDAQSISFTSEYTLNDID
mmetsp:Transcript_45039/g.57668  ORF Transcript_45039/g.57668 Transcript_45039/m.57668 type:complete len:174 (-) Transcript_45039:3-524(-)